MVRHAKKTLHYNVSHGVEIKNPFVAHKLKCAQFDKKNMAIMFDIYKTAKTPSEYYIVLRNNYLNTFNILVFKSNVHSYNLPFYYAVLVCPSVFECYF